MAENESDVTDPRKVANITFAYLRRIENQLGKVKVLLRHETRLGRIERDMIEPKRDIGELKSDMLLLENRILTQANLSIVQRIDEHRRRLDKAPTQPGV